MKKQRIWEIEYLRALAFLAVVLQHTIAHYAYVPNVSLADGVSLGMLLLGSKFAVPLFVFITGLVLFYNYSGPVRYFDFIAKRFKDIILPYLIWSAVYFAASLNWAKLSPQIWIDFLHQVITGKANYHLWYIAMILQFYLLFPLLRRFIAAIHEWSSASAGRIAVVFCLMTLLYVLLMKLVWPIYDALQHSHMMIITPLFTTYADRNSLYFSYYFVLGAFAGLSIESWKEWMRRYPFLINGSFIAMFGFIFYRVLSSFTTVPALRINFNEMFLLRPYMALFLIASILALYRLTMNMVKGSDTRHHRLLIPIGRYSYGGYLVHAILLYVAVWLADSLFWWTNITVRTLLAFALCTAISLLVTFTLSRLPFGKSLVGVGK